MGSGDNGAGGAMAPSGPTPGSFGPKRVVEILRGQPDEFYDFIVSFDPGIARRDVLRDGAMAIYDEVDLPILNGFAATLQVRDAFRIAEIKGVEWVWYLHPDEAEITRNVIKGLEYARDQKAQVIGMSLGPPSGLYRKEPDFDTPVARAMLTLSAQGLLPVVAVGNTGHSAPGTVNPWSTPPWVLSVGAWDHNIDMVWEYSSIADANIMHAWPDVVAAGVDSIQPMTTAREKTDAEREADEENEMFLRNVPKDKWDLYTIRSGTSMAASQVRDAAVQVSHFLDRLYEDYNHLGKAPIISVRLKSDRITDYDDAVDRFTGVALPRADDTIEYIYWADVRGLLIKQILIDTAFPVPGASPWEVGAGRVDIDWIRREFGNYGVATPETIAIKVLE